LKEQLGSFRILNSAIRCVTQQNMFFICRIAFTARTSRRSQKGDSGFSAGRWISAGSIASRGASKWERATIAFGG
jgi:hypothetical protein